MNEQIFLSGAPVVGFGASETHEKMFYGAAVGAPLVGLVIGAIIGRQKNKTGTGAAIGGAVGLGAFVGVWALATVAHNRESR